MMKEIILLGMCILLIGCQEIKPRVFECIPINGMVGCFDKDSLVVDAYHKGLIEETDSPREMYEESKYKECGFFQNDTCAGIFCITKNDTIIKRLGCTG